VKLTTNLFWVTVPLALLWPSGTGSPRSSLSATIRSTPPPPPPAAAHWRPPARRAGHRGHTNRRTREQPTCAVI